MIGHPGYGCLGGQEIWNQARAYAYATAPGGCGSGGRQVFGCDSCGPEMAQATGDPRHWWVSGPLNLAGYTAPDYGNIPTGLLLRGDRFVYPGSHDKFTWDGTVWVYDGTAGADGTAGQEIAAPPYSDPATDLAPWYDTSEPYSADFSGFYVTSIDGLGSGDITRETFQRANGRGSFIGPEVMNSPQIIVTGLLLGKTACAVSYGFRWLKTALRGSVCADDCDGDDLTFLDCCPTWTGDPEADIDPHLRTLRGVKMTASPKITDRLGSGCSCHPDSAELLQVQFTLTASVPCVFRPPVAVATNVPFDTSVDLGCPTWVLIGAGDTCPDDALLCADPPDCIADPQCAAPPAPPKPPAPVNPCICYPITVSRACATIPSTAIPEWAEGVPIITINSGSKDLRQVTLTFIANPLDQPVDDLDPCTACGEVTLSRIPANSQFVMDGTTETVTIICPGSGPTDAGPLLGAVGGSLPFRFPEIPCGDVEYSLCVTADAGTVAPDASVSASIAVREC